MRFPSLKHLICFKEWNSKMVLEVVCSAMNLRNKLCDSHHKKLDLLHKTKVMILQEINEPLVKMAVSKAASLLGADDVEITDALVWEHDYQGRIFSDMADVIFISTKTHACVKRFADKSSVPVLCMFSRTHAPIQSLATIMAIMQHFGTMKGLNIAYVGPPHPVLNSYLLLCPMLGAHIKFKCCCKVCPVSPLLLNASKALTKTTYTVSKQCTETNEALKDASVIIAGPTTQMVEKIPEFMLSDKEINRCANYRWIFLHTCPRGAEVDDDLFNHCNAKTFDAFQNMQYIAAALMAYHIKDYTF
ncbi:hypothetical protein PYW08_009788 [Mythimna loreyi]|uniref:Uncharacterized protein n=1 Tax=Mythimna loreyi TaxID=667449 RepID=A0ACC2Q7Q0_9NEOP|nr:hypothetical protein PYW08_009788 [Mythimna loreyi]